jgi:undecaprenyl pyrophosphate phosphatase UppP
MSSPAVARRSAVVAGVGFAGLIVFQLALVAGAPFGRASWGGTHRVLTASLRLGSVATVVLYALAALVILRRAGYPIRRISEARARRAAWAVVVILTLSAVANLASRSVWELFGMAPFALILAVLSFVVARRRVAEVPPTSESADEMAFAARSSSSRV